jgi:hypothetical protein
MAGAAGTKRSTGLIDRLETTIASRDRARFVLSP